MGDDATLLLLPGLGADARSFGALRDALARPQAPSAPAVRVEVPPWIPAEEGESLAEYAARFAAGLRRDERPQFVGGMSFGGQVALELGRRLRPRPLGVFLIAAPRSRRQITPRFRVQESVGRLAPPAIVRRGLVLLATRFAARERLDPFDTAALLGMALDADLEFLRWGAAAAARWSWGRDVRPEVEVHHVHGRRDDVIPFVEGEPDLVLEDGRHLVNFTHTSAIADFVRARVAATLAGTRRSGEG